MIHYKNVNLNFTQLAMGFFFKIIIFLLEIIGGNTKYINALYSILYFLEKVFG